MEYLTLDMLKDGYRGQQKKVYDLKVRAGVLCKGDRVRVRKVVVEEMSEGS